MGMALKKFLLFRRRYASHKLGNLSLLHKLIQPGLIAMISCESYQSPLIIV